jgi:hypothetical protein
MRRWSRQGGGWLASEAGMVFRRLLGVIVHDADAQLEALADEGLTPALRPGLWSIANWVVRNGVEFSSADLVGRPTNRGRLIRVGNRFSAHSARGQDIGPWLRSIHRRPRRRLARVRRCCWRFGAFSSRRRLRLDNAIALQRAGGAVGHRRPDGLSNSRYLNVGAAPGDQAGVAQWAATFAAFPRPRRFQAGERQPRPSGGSRTLAEAG